MWTGIIAAIVGGGGLTAVGITVDRPALQSEVQVVMEQSIENKVDILYINLKAKRAELWELEDRIEDKGVTPERRDRLRQLEVELEDIQREIDFITEFEQ